MDLNIYNIHFVVGLFGKPTSVQYYPNIENNIDTSGILILSYPTFQCVCIGAKDCKAPLSNTIQGDLGVIHIQTPVSTIVNYEVLMNNHTKYVSPCDHTHRMYYEFQSFVNMHETKNYNKCYKMLEHSMICLIKYKQRQGEKQELFFLMIKKIYKKEISIKKSLFC